MCYHRAHRRMLINHALRKTHCADTVVGVTLLALALVVLASLVS